MILQQVAVGFH